MPIVRGHCVMVKLKLINTVQSFVLSLFDKNRLSPTTCLNWVHQNKSSPNWMINDYY